VADKFRLFAPFTKTETTDDGGRLVEGFGTLEVVDKAGEIIDYPSTVEAFARWSSEIERATGGKSKGNIREMHQPVAVGKIIDWREGTREVDGKTVKGIYTSVRVPPGQTATIEKIDEGILTGFSIGGRYAKRWYDPTVKAHRFTPEFAEQSLVDNPAVPGATFDMVKSAPDGGFELADWLVPLAKADAGDGEGEKAKLNEAAEARAKEYGIAFKDGKGHLTPPAGYPTDPADYGDPVNFKYPIDSKHLEAAPPFFNRDGQQEAGGYTAEEWAKIGKRIADRAGEGYSFKNGKIETPSTKDDAEKAALAETVQKATSGGKLSHGDIRRLVQAAVSEKAGPFGDYPWVSDVYDDHAILEDWDSGKFWSVPYTIKDGAAELGEPVEVIQTWTPAEGATNKVNPPATPTAPVSPAPVAKADPNDEAVDAQIKRLQEQLDKLKAAQAKDDEEEDKEDAEKVAGALEVLKTIDGRLAKRGVAISAERREHLRHAVDHIHHALGEHDEETEGSDHIHRENADPDAMKGLIATELSKSATQIGTTVERAIQGAGLAKASDVVEVVTAQVGPVTEGLCKVNEALTQIAERLTNIESQPMPGGPAVGPVPGFGGATPWNNPELERAALLGLQQRTDDPMVKDALGRALATDLLAQGFAAARGTAVPTGPR